MMKKTTLISLAGLALLPLSNVSYAENQKTYAGSQCEAYYADEAARVRKTNSSIFAGGQPGGQGVAVRCPIVRDNVSNWDGTQAAYVFVAKGDPGAGYDKNVTCTLWSHPDTGDPAVDAKVDQTSDSRAGLFSLNVDVNASRPGGTYILVCRLPPGSGILSYIITEY